MLINEFFYFNEGLSAVDCKSIIEAADGKFEDASVNTKRGISDNERETGSIAVYGKENSVRKSGIFFSSEQWLFDLIWPFMQEANKDAGWEYDISGCEAIQITKYDSSDYYHWHKDGNGCHRSKYQEPDNTWLNGNVRKLSMTVLLSDDYTGGDFQIASLNSGKGDFEVTVHTPPVEGVGSIIVFPSFVMHRINPVKEGVRYSLVAWFVGTPFK